ncbi:MAG: hypothetical protein KKA90_03075 [Nanoarchaeota archaeon]|nr:hypothetical protein [Nanoarchaeota archaeon]
MKGIIAALMVVVLIASTLTIGIAAAQGLGNQGKSVKFTKVHIVGQGFAVPKNADGTYTLDDLEGARRIHVVIARALVSTTAGNAEKTAGLLKFDGNDDGKTELYQIKNPVYNSEALSVTGDLFLHGSTQQVGTIDLAVSIKEDGNERVRGTMTLNGEEWDVVIKQQIVTGLDEEDETDAEENGNELGYTHRVRAQIAGYAEIANEDARVRLRLRELCTANKEDCKNVLETIPVNFGSGNANAVQAQLAVWRSLDEDDQSNALTAISTEQIKNIKEKLELVRIKAPELKNKLNAAVTASVDD